MKFELYKKVVKKEGREYTNLYLKSENGYKYPISAVVFKNCNGFYDFSNKDRLEEVALVDDDK